MAIATGTALLGAAVIGGGASLIAGSKQSKAAKQAAQMAAQSNAQNNATAERFYALNQQALSPWQQQGLGANALMNASLGIGAPTQPNAFGAQTPNPTAAFDAFRNSGGYQFRMGEGLGAVQKAFGRSLDSGAAVKSAMRFGQGLASDEYGRWLQLLDNQQRIGFGAASAQAGVNQNMTSTLIGNNNAGTSAAMNAKLYQGNASANMWNGLGSSFGTALGAMSGNPYAFMGR